MTLILAALVLLQASDREAVREQISRMLGDWCEDTEHIKKFGRISNAALEELPAMIKEADGERRIGLLHLYGCIADWKAIPRTPAVILNLARGGDLAAAEVVFKIRDKRSIDFMLEVLAHMAADERTVSFGLERAMLLAAGRSRSEEVGKRQFALIDVPHMRNLVIEPLGTLAYTPAAGRLRELMKDKDSSVSTAASFALSKIGVPATAEGLVETVRSKRMSGEFSWYRWALERIVNLNLKDAAPALRIEHDEFVRKFGTATMAGQWDAELLHAIHQLGGKLSPEETTLLIDLGRLPPATLSEAGEEKLVEGFDKSVWAPRAQRLKEIAARNAPPPRLTEDQLPRFMKERINFVMDLKPPDPSYLAPDAVLALETIEEMLTNLVNPRNSSNLLQAYLYLARLREGMKTPDCILRLASGNVLAAAIVTTIADDKAEAWFLDEARGRGAQWIVSNPGRLYGAKVTEALLNAFRATDRPWESLVKALVDRGCTEILADLPNIKGNTGYLIIEREKLEILTEPDRQKKLLATVKSLRMSGDFSWYLWALDQMVRLDLKGLAPDLRAWYDSIREKCPPSPNPFLLVNKMPWVLWKLGAPITKDEEELIKRYGRKP